MGNNTPNSNVAIFGATGNVSKIMLVLLAKKGIFDEIRVVTRRPEQIGSHTSIRVIPGNYCQDKDPVMAAMKACSKVFIVLPQSLTSEEMVQHGKFLGDCAKAAEVKTIVRICSFGIDSKSAKHACSQGPFGEAHLTLEKYYSELELNVVSIRPTSFFSNLSFNMEEMRTQSTMSTPLGTTAKVNWVACEDIARVAAAVLAADRWDEYGAVIDVTGVKENTLSGQGMADMMSARMEKSIAYREVEIPTSPDYAGLWQFLRSGGFDCHTDSVEKITSLPSIRIEDI